MNHAPGPMAQKPRPHKETFNNKAQLNIINQFKPTINSGSPVRKHLVTKFKFIDSILTNSNPQSIVVLLCLYSGIIFQGTNYLYPSLQGYITFVSLLFPLIRPHKWYIVNYCIRECFKGRIEGLHFMHV